MKRLLLSVVCLILVLSLIFNLSACTAVLPKAQAADLMENITAQSVKEKAPDNLFRTAYCTFTANLLKESVSREKCTLVSPLSVMLALAMTANGANTQTLAEMENALGGVEINALNEYLYTYQNSLPSSEKVKFSIANSIWFRQDFAKVNPDFLQTNADYYGAAAYKEPFDDSTVKRINKWVDNGTDGMIDKIIDSINPNTIIYLINCLAFDGEWEKTYEKSDVFNHVFTDVKSRRQNVDFLHSDEQVYLSCDGAKGFMKYYKGGDYAFAALLPDEDVSIYDFVENLSGEKLINILDNGSNETVYTAMPKFEFDFDIELTDTLKEMGMVSAFDAESADFSKMAKNDCFISTVIHKTYICVDEHGTKAGAITLVGVDEKSAEVVAKEVILNRPFVCAIIDTENRLPIFIGVVTTMEG